MQRKIFNLLFEFDFYIFKVQTNTAVEKKNISYNVESSVHIPLVGKEKRVNICNIHATKLNKSFGKK